MRWRRLVAVAVAAGAIMAFPSPATASFTWNGCKWSRVAGKGEPPVVWYANIDIDDTPKGGSYVGTAEAGVETWQRLVEDRITLVKSAPSHSDFNIDSTYTGINAPLGTWTYRCTNGYYLRWGGATNENRLRLNQSRLNKEYENFTPQHVQAIMHHELGHMYGLHHSMSTPCTRAIMVPSPSQCWDTNTLPTLEDVSGVKQLYPSPDQCLNCLIKP